MTVIILTLIVVVFTPQPAEAACFSFVNFKMEDCVAGAGDILLKIASFTLTFTGFLLNMSVIFTTHIKDIYDATPAIRNVWVIIRNISSIFIIFMLLYSSIQTILGIGSPNLKKLIGNIIMAGLLINFSLFFTKVAIDASNLVSLQFYRAIAPEYSSTLDNSSPGKWMSGAFYDGGISNVFMQSLKIQTIYHPENSGIKGQTDTVKISAAIIVATYGGVILMLFASISFLAASVAFVIRTVLLLVLMAFSPVYFAGMIFPVIKKDVSNEWMKYLTNQLLFMPIYLLLMYVSMTVISDSGFMSFLQSKDGVTSGSFLMKQMGIVLQYVIAIFFINLPLIGAVKFGAIGTKFAENMTKGLKEKIYSQPGIIGRNTLGRVGRTLGGSFDSTAAKWQSNPVGKRVSSALRTVGISQAVRGGLDTMEKGKYGSGQNLADIEKEDKDRAKVISGVQRTHAQVAAIDAYMGARKTGTVTPEQLTAFKTQMKVADAKELEKMDIDLLTDPHFAASIPTGKFEALVKSDNLTLEQQGKLRKAREDGFIEILGKEGADYLINQHIGGKSQDIAKLPSKIITNPEVAILLDPATLRKMVDENVSRADRDAIRAEFDKHLAKTGTKVTKEFQKAYDYLNNPAGQIF